jgi:membrane-associated HD superfamily phosphohydrolase
MSKMVIISHVKDGMDLAREARLPQEIIDMIPMHHGTTVVEYFFRKARREAEQTAEAPTADTEYRYPGSKPRFREAGILMLADMIEAIAKTETEPHPARFRSMVHAQIHKRLLDGQLNESDLTLNDLRIAEDSFVRTLTNMYHSRIKYPEPEATPDPATVEGVTSAVVMAQRASPSKE